MPRAKCVGATAALDIAKRSSQQKPVVHVDAAYVVKGHAVIEQRCGTGANLDQWQQLARASDEHDPQIVKVIRLTPPSNK